MQECAVTVWVERLPCTLHVIIPEKVRELIVADIAPRDYPPNHHVPTLDALLDLNLSILTSRKDADEKLSELIPNWAFRQFLLTNLIQKEKSFTWKANIQALRDSIEILSSNLRERMILLMEEPFL